MEEIINEMDGLFKQVIKYYPMKDLAETKRQWNSLVSEFKKCNLQNVSNNEAKCTRDFSKCGHKHCTPKYCIDYLKPSEVAVCHCYTRWCGSRNSINNTCAVADFDCEERQTDC
jgi:hypothetical protein